MKKYTITTIITCAFLCFGTFAFLRGAYINLKNEYSGQDVSFSTAYNMYESIKQKDGEYLSGRTYVAYFNGACQRLLDKKCVIDPGHTVTKLNNGYIAFTVDKDDYYYTRDYSERLKSLERLKGQLDEHGIGLTFSNVLERNPLNDTRLPYDCLTFDQDISGMLDLTEKAGISTLNMMDNAKDIPMDYYSLFYRTDHHWNVYGGFYASKMLISHLGYETYEAVTDISSYDERIAKNCFLGSIGRRVGPYYSGLDDFTVLYPKFETDLTVVTNGENERYGSFDKTVIFDNYMPTDNTMNTVAYSAFLNGDNGIQTVKNSMCTNGKKVLLLRDSYGGAMAPYFSLACEELHIIDMRHYDGVAIAQYAVQEDIDDVVIMYSSGSLNKTCFNFDMEQ